MGAETKRKAKSSDNPPKPPGSKKRYKQRDSRTASKAQYVALVTAFILTGNKWHSCIAAGLSPLSAHYFFTQKKVQDMIVEYRPEVEKRAKEKAIEETVKGFELTAEFLDANTAHIIVNSPTHFMRGDSDRVKAIELGYKRLNLIESPKIINNNQANALAAGGNAATFLQVYESQWLIEKKRRMAEQLENKYAQLPPPTPAQ